MNDITSVRSACCLTTGTGGPPARTTTAHTTRWAGRRAVEGRRDVWDVAQHRTARGGRDPPKESGGLVLIGR